MLKFIQKKLKEEKGLTLIELLAVIVILGIIAAIAIPAIGNVIENSRYNAVKGDALNVINAAQLYYAETTSNPESPVKVSTLVSQGYLESQGEIPNDASVTQQSPRELTTSAITYSGSKTVTFSGATVEEINDDPQTGSSDGNTKTIPAGGGTGNTDVDEEPT